MAPVCAELGVARLGEPRAGALARPLPLPASADRAVPLPVISRHTHLDSRGPYDVAVARLSSRRSVADARTAARRSGSVCCSSCCFHMASSLRDRSSSSSVGSQPRLLPWDALRISPSRALSSGAEGSGAVISGSGSGSGVLRGGVRAGTGRPLSCGRQPLLRLRGSPLAVRCAGSGSDGINWTKPADTARDGANAGTSSDSGSGKGSGSDNSGSNSSSSSSSSSQSSSNGASSNSGFSGFDGFKNYASSFQGFGKGGESGNSAGKGGGNGGGNGGFNFRNFAAGSKSGNGAGGIGGNRGSASSGSSSGGVSDPQKKLADIVADVRRLGLSGIVFGAICGMHGVVHGTLGGTGDRVLDGLSQIWVRACEDFFQGVMACPRCFHPLRFENGMFLRDRPRFSRVDFSYDVFAEAEEEDGELLVVMVMMMTMTLPSTLLFHFFLPLPYRFYFHPSHLILCRVFPVPLIFLCSLLSSSLLCLTICSA
ncbi:unnamed protein product [Closterium sp. NIES-53]